MVKFPLIVCYYTKDTLYQLEVQNLIASCEAWGLEHLVEPIASFGSWEKNCCYKPLFLLEKLQQLRRPLFWVDADGVFVKEPQWLDVFEKDLAVRINQDLDNAHPSKVITGSVFINATQGAVSVLKCWAQECIDSFANPTRTHEVWDQIALRDVFLRGTHGAQIGALPLGYMAIADHPLDQQKSSEFVITHYQASRRLKKIVNNAS